LEHELRNRFESTVEAVRIGSVIARDKKAYRQWQRHVAKSAGKSPGLTGQALEQAVMSFAMQNPDLVHYQRA
jgi:hypothetical protein